MSSPGPGDATDMTPEATREVLNRIQQAVDGWAAAWTGLLAAIRAEEAGAQTGFDDVSTQFRTSYNQIEPALTARTEAFAPDILGVLGTGRSIVDEYVRTFEAAADTLRIPGANRTAQ